MMVGSLRRGGAAAEARTKFAVDAGSCGDFLLLTKCAEGQTGFKIEVITSDKY
jgi:hypothetical protein